MGLDNWCEFTHTLKICVFTGFHGVGGMIYHFRYLPLQKRKKIANVLILSLYFVYEKLVNDFLASIHHFNLIFKKLLI